MGQFKLTYLASEKFNNRDLVIEPYTNVRVC
jgi:hypothetical protein